MALFEIVREVDLTPQQAWDRITDWERQGDHVPLTRIRSTADGFVARTGVGPLGFDDPMTVVESHAPTYCRIEKTGRVVTGWAEIEIAPHGAGSRVTWREDASPVGVPRLADPLVRAGGRLLFGRVLDGLFR